jgi:DNA mismatch repair ATPase MutS
MIKDPHIYYTEQAAAYTEKYIALKKRYNFTSTLRVAVFLIMLVLLMFFANQRDATGLWITLAVGVLLFVMLLKEHQKIAYQTNHAEFLKVICEEELFRLQGLVKSFDKGLEYLQTDHAYASDLDVFGQNSMFQHINRTATSTGKDTLAAWLMHPVKKETILQRQEAVKELAAKPEWRQEYQALGRHYKQPGRKETTTLQDWLVSPSVFKGKKWVLWATWILPPITVFLVIMSFYGWSWWIWAVLVGVQVMVLKQTVEDVRLTYEQIGTKAGALRAYSGLLKMLESEKFQSPWIQQLQAQLTTHGTPASKALSDLFGLVRQFEARANMIYGVLNSFLMLDHFLMMRLEAWKKENAHKVVEWIDAVDEMDAANSFAGLLFLNPHWVMPEIADEAYTLEVQQMGHMLLPANQRVTNDLSMNGRGNTLVLTGSNMSGKSTFLRTLGTNMVLALAGAPVCASSFRLSVMQVFTGMRTNDSLEENISSFYAELKRIKQLLDLIPHAAFPVFYFLDEILKGTNSQDRHAGAKALIRQLHQAEASGIISTHDLELGQLEQELVGSVYNYSFNSTVTDGKIVFDYKLSRGICRSFNALAMMKNMGIRINT